MSKSGSDDHKLDNIDDLVWDALNQFGQTIPEIRDGSNSLRFKDNLEHVDTMNEPIWHTKSEVDKYVEQMSGKKLSDYGPRTRNNSLYNKIVKSIGRLRQSGALIDWQKSDNVGSGVWRLDKTKFETHIQKTLENQDAKKNFYCSSMPHTISARRKQQQFREVLLTEYQICMLCRFRLADYLIGAHIVPYHVMRDKDPNNSMNPANGLLLCRFCDVAFEKGTIMIGNDYYIDVSENLKSNDGHMVNTWLKHVPKKLEVGENAKYPPDQKFLKWKTNLLEECM